MGSYRIRTSVSSVLLFLIVSFSTAVFAESLSSFSAYSEEGRSVIITTQSDQQLRITPYGDYMVRVQAVRQGEDFFEDDHYEIVERHDWEGALEVAETDDELTLTSGGGVVLRIAKSPLKLSFAIDNSDAPVLEEDEGITWEGNTLAESFVPDNAEHFAGLGHTTYGRIPHVDRRGTTRSVKSGGEGACVVPFYLSSKGYGVLLNTTFTHTVAFNDNNDYSLSINDEGYGGRMDYFFIAGPKLPQVLGRYMQLSGLPRMLTKSIFGLHLSDKSDPGNRGESWWKDMISKHRNAGFPFDHQVNDNAWRASNEATSGQKNSWFEFRKDRYPDPAAYKRWGDQNGITVTLDLNRPGIQLNPSWDPSLDINGNTQYGACPDFTKQAAREWIWDLFWDHAFNPSLGYPGDAIWLDEFDYPDHNHNVKLSNGRYWAEESINYHYMTMRACVKEGWDPAMKGSKRPYFWIRGITAGAQRYGIYWTGDLAGNWEDMAYQVRAMQAAGLSGFPFFNHDAGGHHNQTANSDNLFCQWDYAFGSFTPIWKPHGPSHKRWPLQNSSSSQAIAKRFCTTRYEMMPYIYSYAHIAARTGMPMVRSMFFEDQDNETAWQKDMQYYWGKEMLVAPNCTDGNNNVSVWFPEGDWYDFWNDDKIEGNKTTNYYAAKGVLPVFVKAGAIIPKAPFAKSTFWITHDTLNIHVYAGADGNFTHYEDDGVTEKHRLNGEIRTTQLHYNDAISGVTVGGAEGTYDNAPDERAYQIIYHGLAGAPTLFFNGSPIQSYSSTGQVPRGETGIVWNGNDKLATVVIPSQDVETAFIVSSDAEATHIGNMTRKTLASGTMHFSRNTFSLNSACDIGPVSVLFHHVNGKVIHTSGMITPQRSGAGYAYSCSYQPVSAGLYIVHIRSNDTELSKRVMISK